jgi:hypothetical protein
MEELLSEWQSFAFSDSFLAGFTIVVAALLFKDNSSVWYHKGSKRSSMFLTTPKRSETHHLILGIMILIDGNLMLMLQNDLVI